MDFVCSRPVLYEIKIKISTEIATDIPEVKITPAKVWGGINGVIK